MEIYLFMFMLLCINIVFLKEKALTRKLFSFLTKYIRSNDFLGNKSGQKR